MAYFLPNAYVIQVHQGSCQIADGSEWFLDNGNELVGSRAPKRLYSHQKRRRLAIYTGAKLFIW
jgi:hypothetical protein